MMKKLIKSVRFLLTIAAAFVAVVALMAILRQLPGAREVYSNNERRNIEAETLFYTETSQFNETNNYMNNTKVK
jgi:uncharacterized membrane protein